MTQEKKAMSIPYFGLLVIVASVFMGWIIYHFILGASSNFEGGNNENKALAGNYLGIMYKGGVIVPLLIGILLIVFTFAIERFVTIRMARGSGAVEPFVRKVRGMLSNGQMDEAIAECDKQRGSVANV